MSMTDAERARWTGRFGTIGGGCAGLLGAFGAAWATERAGADPEWILRLGSAAGMLGGGWLGQRLGTRAGARSYTTAGMLAGIAVSATATILLLSAIGAAK